MDGRVALLGLLLVASAMGATSWGATTNLQVNTSSPPVTFAAGDNAANSRYIKSFSVSADGTTFSADVKPRAGAEMVVTDVVRLTTANAQDQAIRLSATSISNANIEQFEWRIYDGTTLLATLDHLAGSPEATFTLPAGGTVQMDLHIDLANGAGKTNAGVSFDMTLEVTP